MKILFFAPYYYNQSVHEYTRNKTGFGIMVYNIIEAVQKTEETYFLSNVISKRKDDTIIHHSVLDVLRSAKFADWRRACYYFIKFPQSLKERCRYFYYGLNAGCMREAIKKKNPDIVNIHGIGHSTKGIIEVCEEENVPFLVTLHGLIGLDSSIKAPLWEKTLEEEFLNEAHRKGIPVSVISTGMKRRIEYNYIHRESDNVRVICNGTKVNSPTALMQNEKIPSEQITHKEKGFSSFLPKYIDNLSKGLFPSFPSVMNYLQMVKASGKKLVVTVGNISTNKNQIVIAEALEKTNVDNYIFIVVGKEADHGFFRHNLLEHGLAEKIIMTGQCNEMEKIWTLVDLNFFPSKNDGFGLVVIEGLAFGVPCLMYNDLDAADDLRVPGCIFINREDDIINSINQCLEHNIDKERIQQASHQFCIEHTAQQYIQLYHRIIEGKME